MSIEGWIVIFIAGNFLSLCFAFAISNRFAMSINKKGSAFPILLGVFLMAVFLYLWNYIFAKIVTASIMSKIQEILYTNEILRESLPILAEYF